MKTFWKWLVGVVTAIVAALFIFRKNKKSPSKDSPPKNPITEVVVEQINDDLEEEVSKVKSAVEGSSAAEDLAKLGDLRSRS